MLTFFRKIRTSLVESLPAGQAGRSTRRYVLYTIGEILLVVLGILIALQINNWNEERQNRIQEQEILKQLKEEYRSNLDQIDQKIRLRAFQMASCLQVLSYRKRSDISEDSLNFHLQRVATWPTFDPATGITDELISSGKLYVIQNPELRKQLTTWPKYYQELREEEVILSDWVTGGFINFLQENYQLGRFYLDFEDDETSQLWLLSSESKIKLSISFTPGNMKSLIGNPDLEDWLVRIFSQTDLANNQSRGVKTAIENILELINQEIDGE